MKTNQTPEDDRALRQVLREWKVDTPLPPRFEEEVWQRIARGEAQPAPTLWASLWPWVEVLLPHPRFAYSYMAALLVLGVVGGSLAAQVRTKAIEADLSLRYVQSLDPYYADASHR